MVYLGKKRLYGILKGRRPDVCMMKLCVYRRFRGVEVLTYFYLVPGSEELCTYGKLSSQFGGKWMKIREEDFDGAFLCEEFLARISGKGITIR